MVCKMIIFDLGTQEYIYFLWFLFYLRVTFIFHKPSGELNETLKGQDLFVVSQAKEGIPVRKSC